MDMKGVNGGLSQGWDVDLTTADLQNGPTNGGVVNTPPVIKRLPLASRRVTWIKTKREGVYVKSGRSDALKPGKLNFA